MNRLCSAIAVLLLLGAAADARPVDQFAHASVMESLSSVHPRLRGRWLRDRGIEDPARAPSAQLPDSLGLRLVGRWSYGPAYDVDCRMTSTDTLIALARGSGVSIARLNRSSSPRFEILSDINCDRRVGDVRLLDTLVLVSCYGLEVWGISDPTRPNRHSRIETDLLGFDARDSLVYTVGYDSFQVISVADPANPRLVGACRDSGSVVSVAGNTAFVANVAGLFAIDVSNPVAPHRVGSWGGGIFSLAARGNICCVTQLNPNQNDEELSFTVLNVANPSAITPLGYLGTIGGWDMHVDGDKVFLSGYQSGGHEFRIVDISDSTRPTVLGSCATIGDNYGVWATEAGNLALVADSRGGLAVVDITNQSQPSVDTIVLRAGQTLDLSMVGRYGYVASDGAGLRVLDLADPTAPEWVGSLDTANAQLTVWSVAARDSFVYTSWRLPYLRVVDVTDPTRPQLAAGCNVVAAPKALALRDSLLYLAADGQFDVVNVARPRQPRVVGTCNTTGGIQWGMELQGSLAYLNSWDGLTIIDIAQPSSPRLISQTSSPHGRVASQGLAVHDSLVFIASCYETLWVFSVADPDSPRVVAGAPLGPGGWGYDADMLDDSTVAVGCRAFVRLVDVRDPLHPVAGASYPVPSYVRRVVCEPPYIYAACTDGGFVILEPAQTGVCEERTGGEVGRAMRVWPSVTRGRVSVGGTVGPWRLLDVSGKVVAEGSATSRDIDLSRLAPGVYFVSPASSVKRDASGVTKVVITR